MDDRTVPGIEGAEEARSAALTARLRATEAALDALLEQTSDLGFLADTDGRLLTVNRAWRQKLGLTGATGALDLFLAPDARDPFDAAARRALAGEPGVTLATTFRAWDGGTIDAVGSLLRQERATGPTVCGLFRDISAQRFQEARQAHIATRDSLTSLANRPYFAQHLPLALARARRQGTLVGVVLVDLDAFRDINAAFGHAGGDEVLTAVADRLTRSVRTEDLAARFEADRFALVLERLHTLADATLVVERTAAAIATPLLTYVGEWVRPAASLGVSLGDGTVADGEVLLRAAEGALAQAKRAGGERIIFAASPDDAAATPADLLAAP